MKLVNSPSCNHCNNIDSVKHRFIECNDVKLFWENVVIYFNNIHNTNFSLNKEHIIFGVLEHTHTPMIIYLNTYILIAKYWIHLCRLKQHNPELQGFTKILFKHIENEKYINTIHLTNSTLYGYIELQ